MTISVRPIGKYCDVEVTLDNTKVALGLMDEDERKKLADTLNDAVKQLLDSDDYKELLEKELSDYP